MKKVAVIPAVVLAALCTFTGCKKEEVEKVIAPLVSDGQTTESTEEAQEEKDPLIPEIDTSVELQAGSRVAVVSKSTSGEFWGLVKKGMEQAIADVNEAYGFKKEDQVTMTFEGASDEKEPGKYHRCGNCRESGCTLCFCQRYGFPSGAAGSCQGEWNPGCGI